MTSSTGQAKATHPRRWGIAARAAVAAMAVALLATGPRSAAAQTFTLTFDSPEPTGSNNTYVSTSTATLYQNGSTGWNGLVNITDGFVSGGNFGTTLIASGNNVCGVSSNNHDCGVVYATGSANGTTGIRYADLQGGTRQNRAGEFLFTPQGNNAVSLVSFDLKNTNSSGSQSLEFQLWGLTCACEVGSYSALSVLGTTSQTVTFANFSYQGPLGSNLQNQLSGGFRFEWRGSSYTASNSFVIDNIAFTNFVPEPTTVALLGTGLMGLAPVILRRRRRRV